MLETETNRPTLYGSLTATKRRAQMPKISAATLPRLFVSSIWPTRSKVMSTVSNAAVPTNTKPLAVISPNLSTPSPECMMLHINREREREREGEGEGDVSIAGCRLERYRADGVHIILSRTGACHPIGSGSLSSITSLFVSLPSLQHLLFPHPRSSSSYVLSHRFNRQPMRQRQCEG